MSLIIRPALASDAASCAAVYAPYASESCVTFESPAPDAAEFARRIAEVTRCYPWLVCELDGAFAGYAYAHRFRERRAFDWDVELSIYLAAGLTGRGIGAALYGALFELLRRQGIVNAYATIATPNAASERLHEKMGLRRLFTLENTAWKLGQWRDLSYYSIRLNDLAPAPAPIIPYPELGNDAVRRACGRNGGAA